MANTNKIHNKAVKVKHELYKKIQREIVFQEMDFSKYCRLALREKLESDAKRRKG